jgi:DNA-directed RNA polymerase subunit beta'
MKRYRDIKLYDEDSQDLDVYMHEILERRKQEEAEALEAEVSVQNDYVVEETED